MYYVVSGILLLYYRFPRVESLLLRIIEIFIPTAAVVVVGIYTSFIPRFAKRVYKHIHTHIYTIGRQSALDPSYIKASSPSRRYRDFDCRTHPRLLRVKRRIGQQQKKKKLRVHVCMCVCENGIRAEDKERS